MNKFTLSTITLQKALQDISSVLKSSSKTEGQVVQLQIEGTSLKFSARNSGTILVSDVTFTGDPQPSRTVSLSPTPFIPYVNALTVEQVDLELTSTSIILTTPTDNASFSFMPAEFFWDTTSKKLAKRITIRADVLQEMYDQLSYATLKPTDQLTTPFKLAIHLEAQDNVITASTSSAIQMARIIRPVIAPNKFVATMFISDFKVLVSLLKSSKEEIIDLYFGQGLVGFEAQISPDYSIAFLVALLQDDFPDVNRLCAQESDTQVVKIPKQELISAITKIQLVTTEVDNSKVAVRFGQDSKAEAISAANSICITLPKTDQELSFMANLPMLLAAIKHAAVGSGNYITLKFYPSSTEQKNIVYLRDDEDPNQIHGLSLLRNI